MMTSGRPRGLCEAASQCWMRWRRASTSLGDRAGAGSKVKTIHQLLAGVHIAAAAEAMALGTARGRGPAGALRGDHQQRRPAAGCSATAWRTCSRATTRRLSSVDIFVKDLGLVLDLARAQQVPAAARLHRAPDVHAGLQRRAREGGRQRGDQDLPGHPPCRRRSSDAAPRLHRRRPDRRDGCRVDAAERGHAHDPGDRRSRTRQHRAAGRRRGGGGAEVAHQRARRGGGAIARRARVAARRGR